MKKKVLVAMSGGVDSSGAALLLRQEGYDVSGATLHMHCLGKENVAEDAAKVAREIGIEHFTLDRSDLFRREVMKKFVSEYEKCRTPNPCIDCNRELKFGALLDWAVEQGFDYVATGHYARLGYDDHRPSPFAAGRRPQQGSELCALPADAVPAAASSAAHRQPR